jgi:YD repeat-containing protein
MVHRTTYDSFGRVSCVTTPHTTTASATDGSTCNTVYDQFDRVQTIQQPDGNTVGLSYTDNSVTTTDEVGHKHQNTYNAFGDLTSVFEQDNAGTLDWQTVYQYDGLDRLMRVDQKGASTVQANWRTRTFAYDSLSRLTHQTTPEAGTLTFNTYDADGNLRLATDARGLTVQYHYDALNRLTSKVLQNGSTYVYNYDARDSSSDPYGVGRLTSMQNGTSAGAYFTHDLSGNVASEKYCLPSDCTYTQAAQAKYDYHGNVVNLTYPDGRYLYRNYDLLDRLTQTGENSFLVGGSVVAAQSCHTLLCPAQTLLFEPCLLSYW